MRIGLLGAARITSSAIIAPAKVMPSAVLHGVAARDRQRAQAFADQHGVTSIFDDYANLVSAADIDLVYNALPISLHAAWTIEALQAGKHVLCEKPLAMNANEARQMIDATSASGVRLIEAFHHRYHPAFQIFLDWISAGSIGDIKEVDAAFNVPISDDGVDIRHRPETGGGAMMDLGCYPVSWVLSVTNTAPSSIAATATMTPSGVDESMAADLTFPNGIKARLAASMAPNQIFSARLCVVGTKGQIDFINPISPHSGASLKLAASGQQKVAPISRVSTYTHQLSAVLDAIESGAPLPTEGAGVLCQQETLDAIYAAAGLSHLRLFS
ncbi:MAG: Gfo/Idh/MocA family protein [Pseudomonadales bacterium]